MASLHHTVDGARGLLGSSMSTVRRHPRASAAIALTAAAGGAALAGLARYRASAGRTTPPAE